MNFLEGLLEWKQERSVSSERTLVKFKVSAHQNEKGQRERETAFTKTLKRWVWESGGGTYLGQSDVNTRTNNYNLSINIDMTKMSRHIFISKKWDFQEAAQPGQEGQKAYLNLGRSFASF